MVAAFATGGALSTADILSGGYRTRVGKRRCWKIDVSSPTCNRQNDDLFDQKINAV
jgi:hypothetical protein